MPLVLKKDERHFIFSKHVYLVIEYICNMLCVFMLQNSLKSYEGIIKLLERDDYTINILIKTAT